MRRHPIVLLVLLILLLLVFVASAQAPPTDGPVPKLTEVQRLTLQNTLQRVEIAQLKLQAANAEFDAAREAFLTFVKTLSVDGYDLHMQTGEYRKKTPPEKK